METGANALNWFEIPATDMNRAKDFYEKAFNTQLQVVNMMGMEMGMFPSDWATGKVGGALVKSDYHKPSQDGTIVYLNANPNMEEIIGRIGEAGGQIVMPKTLIDEQTGYMAFFIDSEGNKMGLHSNN